ncbi:MAG TPA: septal ring lytic transglycosylase RlpA family protein [Xanthobacteraceae bacterium]|nr:septal ring lytic transglycosylase RlpA family protein [Xanthobacteraceae bacterium]
MRAGIFIVAAMACAWSGAQPAAAQPLEPEARVWKTTGTRGFDWFFANVKRPDGPCSGEIVVATWYASGSHTASGQAFDPNGHTAAHRTLPFGTKLTVTNPHNSQSVVVTINDRGPFTKGVTLDLALGAARAIGMTQTQWVCISGGNQAAVRQ